MNKLLIGMKRKYSFLFWIFLEKGNKENIFWEPILGLWTISSLNESSKVAKNRFTLNKPMHQATLHVLFSEKEMASQKLQTFWEAEFDKHQITN